jgi:hypothetical protein
MRDAITPAAPKTSPMAPIASQFILCLALSNGLGILLAAPSR